MTDFMAGEWAYLKVQEKDKPTRLTKKMLNDVIDAKPIPLDRTTLIRNDFGIVKRDDEDYSDGFTYRLKNDSGIYQKSLSFCALNIAERMESVALSCGEKLLSA